MLALIRSFIVLCCFAALSCAKSQSSAIATSEIYLQLSVEGDSANTVICYATLRVGGGTGTYLELSGEDKLTCGDGTTEVEMTKGTDFLGIVQYRAPGLTYEVGREYTVTFTRAGAETHESTVTLPAAMQILSPSAGNHTKNTPLTVTWTAGGGDSVDLVLSWTSGSSSGSSGTMNSADDGSEAFTATHTRPLDSDGEAISGPVNATVKVTREVAGTIASGVKGGTITGEQEKSVAITLVD